MAGQLEYSATAASNTAINGIGIQGSSTIKNGDDAMRQLMADQASAITRHVTKAIGTYTAVKADYNQLWRATGAVTLNLTAAATLTDGWGLWVKADGGAVTVDPNGAETINGAATLSLPDGFSAFIVCTGTAFFAVVFGNGEVTLTGTQTMSNKSFVDASTWFVDDGDQTKKLLFQISGFTTSTTRTVTWPDASGTVLLTSADATLTAGFMSTAVNNGTQSSGTYTPTPVGGNFKTITNGGAFTLAAPTAAGSYNLEIDITNNASAGAITFTGFVAGNPKGDPLTTTNGNKFKLHISKTANGVTATVEACQ